MDFISINFELMRYTACNTHIYFEYKLEKGLAITVEK